MSKNTPNDGEGLTAEQLQAQAQATLDALTETGVKADMTDKGQVRILSPDKEVERPFYYRAYKKGLQAVGRPVPSYDEWLSRWLERNGLSGAK